MDETSGYLIMIYINLPVGCFVDMKIVFFNLHYHWIAANPPPSGLSGAITFTSGNNS